MAADKPEGDSFLSLLDAKIAALQTLRDVYIKALALGALGQPGDEAAIAGGSHQPIQLQGFIYGGGGTNSSPMELPTGAFLGKSIPEAIKLYLSAVKKKQTAREIATALKEGGMESTASNWETTVTGALHRLKTAGAVLRFKDGWGLAELYPESLRSRLAKDDKPRKRGRPRKAAKPNPSERGIRLRDVLPPAIEEKAS
jgi:hypothetical protein